ncbi:alpha-glucoside ABC transporter substrate-binding protein [Streptomyces venezuelae]|uniref:Alpha-glucoside ABC transporter substrate-binding protein n=1 Tax=Streptomyces venezuelae TaxID=54571 RepID=A0A5P2CH62_STRVZ|nr:alpha-glucoside ABC transporter substrate-binding protein [Streptomyces venezuelae]QES42172.1 alpha-glucoside ABC transporter substrate-binding protein [Streptomyces venezuelae]
MSPRTSRRARPRTAFRAFLATCLLAVTAGACGSERPETLVVLGPWTGPEGKAFEAMLHRLDDGTGKSYTYQGTRSLRETLGAQLEAGDPPDVAILNSIGELVEHARAGHLTPLDRAATARAYPPWAPRLDVDGGRRTYWVPLKVDLKSLVWSKEGSSAGRPRWCVGLASQATSGWPGTDWIEDILLHQAGPATYTRWATGEVRWRDPRVRKAWTTWAELLGKRTEASIDRSLTTPYVGPRGLLDSQEPRCTHEHQSAFIRYVYAHDRVRVDPAAGYLGGRPEHDGAYEVAGDMAAVFSDDPAARALVDRLSGKRARTLWRARAADGLQPFFPDATDPQPTDPTGRRIAGILTAKARTLCFDASDVMPPGVRDAFHRAVLQYFGDPTVKRLDRLLAQLDTVRTEAAKDAAPGHMPESEVCAPPGG